MYARDLDVSDPEALEAAMEAVPTGTLARVETPEGEGFVLRRVTGGWHLSGDMAIASGDVVDGDPAAVALLMGEADRGDDGVALLADVDPDDARGLSAWREDRLVNLFGEDPYDERDGQ